MADRDVGGVRVKIGGDNSGLKESVDEAKKQLGGLDKSAAALNTTFKALGGVIAATIGALSVGKIIEYADAWSEMRARVNNAKGEMESTDAIMRRLNDVATRTYSSLTLTAESWLRNSTALKEMGYSTKQQLDLTETLNNALVVSATRGDRARSVMDAWSKAMATGKLQGDNFNSIIQGSDRLAKALADSLNVSTGELRKMAADGKITSEVMFGVTSQLDKLRGEADGMPATMADAATAWDKAFQVIVGTVDTALGSTTNLAAASVDLARAFEGQAENIATFFIAAQAVMDQAMTAIGSALESMGVGSWGLEAALIAAGAAAAVLTVSLASGVVGAIAAVGAALMALVLTNPITLIIASIGAAIAAVFLFRDEIKQAIGVDVAGIFKDIGNTIIGAFVLAFQAVPPLAEAAWNSIVKSAQSIPENLSAIWETVKGGFFGLMSALTARWQDFLLALAGGIQNLPGMQDAFGNLMGAAGKASASQHGFSTAQNQANAAAQGHRDKAAALGKEGDVGMAKAIAGIGEMAKDTMSVDYLGELASGLGKVWENASAAREEIAGMQAELGGADGEGGGGTGGGGGSGGGKAAKQAEQLQKQLDQLRESFMTEEELENEAYAKKLETLQQFYDNRMIMEDEYLSMIEQARIAHEEKLDAIRRVSMEKEMQRYTQMGGYIKGTLSAISSVMDSEGDKQIGIQKAVSLAIAGINVAEGITKALTLPFPMNLLAAAQTAAQGMAAIASINSSSRGSSGVTGTSVASAGGAAAANTPSQQTMVIRGYDPSYFYSGEQVRTMAESLIQYQKDGGQVVWGDQ